MKKISIIIISLIGMVALLCIGFLMTANETNINNFKNITLADGTTIGIPADFTVKKPFSNYTENDGFYYTNCDLESKNYGWIHIEYTHDPVETMTHGSNSTKAIDPEHDGIYEFDVFDSNGHRVMKITGSNPAIVEKIGKSVKFPTNNTVTKVNNTTGGNTTVEKISNNDNQQQQTNDNQQQNTVNEKQNQQNTYIGKDGKTHTFEEAYSVDYSSGDLNIINQQRRERGMSEISA